MQKPKPDNNHLPTRSFCFTIYLESWVCLLYTSDAADDLLCVDLGGRRIIKKKRLLFGESGMAGRSTEANTWPISPRNDHTNYFFFNYLPTQTLLTFSIT